MKQTLVKNVLKIEIGPSNVWCHVIIALQGQIRWLKKEKRCDLWEIRALSCKAYQELKYLHWSSVCLSAG